MKGARIVSDLAADYGVHLFPAMPVVRRGQATVIHRRRGISRQKVETAAHSVGKLWRSAHAPQNPLRGAQPFEVHGPVC